MRTGIALIALMLLVELAAAQTQKAPPKTTPPPPAQPAKGVEVTLDGLKSITPTNWKPEKPANLLRPYQFRLPRADGDKEDAVVFILNTVQGTPEENLARWKDLFVLATNIPKDQASRQFGFKNSKAALTCLDIQGTYLVKHKPIDVAVQESRPEYRMIAALWVSKDNGYSIRLIGPKRTVELYAKAFEQWLRGFK